MIRINLLAERKAREGATAPGPATGTGEAVTGTLQSLLLALVLIGVLAGLLGFGYYVKHTVASLQEEIRQADAELARLAEIRKKMDDYTKQKELLEKKVNLITELKRNQQVPVHLLDQISRNLPDFLWLDSMRQDAGNHIVLVGKATTYNAVADFYNRLIQSGWFENVTQGKVYEVSEGVAFNLTADFSAKKIKAPEEQQGQS
jgi:Tfp pilus assembly protein PilN